MTNAVGVGTWMPASTLNAGGAGINYWTLDVGNIGINTTNNIGIGTISAINALNVLGNVGVGTISYSKYLTTAAPAGGAIFEGNVGIGSLTPGQKLDIKGTVRDNGEIIFGNVGIGTSSLQTAFAVTNGNVGIGTWSPNALLDLGPTLSNSKFFIYNGLVAAGDTDGITQLSGEMRYFGDNGGGSNTYQTNMTFGFLSDTAVFQERMRLTGVGNLGIGSTTPGQLLDVNGTARMTGFTLSNNGASAGNVLVTNAVGVGTWMPASTLPGTGTAPGGGQGAVQYNNAAAFAGDATKFAFDGTNIGIGTSGPHNKLDIFGNVGIGTLANSLYLTTPAPSGGMLIEGNVGIGSLNPVAALDVNGTLRSTSISEGGTTAQLGATFREKLREAVVWELLPQVLVAH